MPKFGGFAFGMFVGLEIALCVALFYGGVLPENAIGAFSALGTLGAAFAALYSAYISRMSLERSIDEQFSHRRKAIADLTMGASRAAEIKRQRAMRLHQEILGNNKAYGMRAYNSPELIFANGILNDAASYRQLEERLTSIYRQVVRAKPGDNLAESELQTLGAISDIKNVDYRHGHRRSVESHTVYNLIMRDEIDPLTVHIQ